MNVVGYFVNMSEYKLINAITCGKSILHEIVPIISGSIPPKIQVA